MKQSVLIHFFKKPTAVSGNAMPTAHVSTENVSIQSRPSTKRKATDSADSLGEYEQPKRLRAFQPGLLGYFGWLRFDKMNSLMYCLAELCEGNSFFAVFLSHSFLKTSIVSM